MSEKLTPRPELGRFAELMEVVLRDNDYKGGWSAMTPEEIVNRMFDELREPLPASSSRSATWRRIIIASPPSSGVATP